MAESGDPQREPVPAHGPEVRPLREVPPEKAVRVLGAAPFSGGPGTGEVSCQPGGPFQELPLGELAPTVVRDGEAPRSGHPAERFFPRPLDVTRLPKGFRGGQVAEEAKSWQGNF